jgi:hypothetical protein
MMKNHAVTRSAIVTAGAIVIAGCAITLAAPASQAAAGTSRAATDGWRKVATVTQAKGAAEFDSIAAVSASDAWASGRTITSGGKQPPVIEHWAGRSWQRLRLSATAARTWRSFGLSGGLVTASSARNAWVVGWAASAIHYTRYNGHRWAYGSIPGNTQQALTVPVVVRTFGPHDTWVFGVNVSVSAKTSATTPYAAQFTGHRWVHRRVPGSGAIVAVTSVSPRNMLALVGTDEYLGLGTSTPTMVRWNGRKWTPLRVRPTGLPGASNATAMAVSRGHIWIAGDHRVANPLGTWADFAAELTGSQWRVSHLPGSSSSTDFELASLVPDGRGGLWALGTSYTAGVSQRLWHYAGRLWRAPISPRFGGSASELSQLTAVPGTDSIWGAGILSRGGAYDGLIALEGPTPR